VEHGFNWMSLIPGVAGFEHSATALLVVIALLTWATVARRQFATANDPVVPDGTITARNAVEMFVELFVVKVMKPVLGDNWRPYIPLYGTFFLFIFVSNLSGLLPGFGPPTSNFNVTLGLGITSFVMYNYYGFQKHGKAYLKHFMGPIWWLAVLMVPLELIDNFVRPASLALRLFGNMTGDHLVLDIFTRMTYLGIPVLFLMLGAFVSLIQAFVFTLLSMVYLSLATAGHDHHADDHHAGEHGTDEQAAHH